MIRRSIKRSFFILPSLLFLFIFACVEAGLSTPEAQALADFINTFSKDYRDWDKNNITDGACDFDGITCVAEHITGLNFYGDGWTAYLPDSISNLAQLTRLDFGATNLTGSGSITTSLQKLNLTLLHLAQYTKYRPDTTPRDFPYFLKNMTTLSDLAISWFNFSQAPDALAYMPPNLTTLTLNNCQFGGDLSVPLPTSLNNHLALSNNGIGGSLPDWLGTLTSLGWLEIENSPITGSIPTAIGNMTSLGYIYLSNNQLTGPIPDSINNLRYLRELHLWGNQLNGTIPAMNNLSSLRILDLHDNHLQGNLATNGLQALSSTNADFVFCNMSHNDPDFVCPSNFTLCCTNYIAGATTSNTVTIATAVTTTASTLVATAASATSGTTSSCSGYECLCSSDLKAIIPASSSTCQADGTWQINGNATNDKTVTIGASDTVVINGTYTQSSSGVLQVYVSDAKGEALVINGNTQLSGTLVIVITSEEQATGNTTYKIISTTTGVEGEFTTVRVDPQYGGSKCYSIQGSPTYTATSISVLLTKTKTGKCGKNNTGRTIGIAVGASVGAVIVIAVVAIILIVVLKASGKCSGLWWDSSTQHSKDQL